MQMHKDPMRNRFIPITAWLVTAIALLAAGVSFAQTPDTFTWSGGATGTWNAPGGWTPLATSRTFPEIAGDQVVTTNATTLTLNGNTTVSRISVGGGNLTLSSDGVVTQTFESASAAVSNKIYSVGRHLYLGDDPVDDDLVMNIKDNLIFSGNHSGYLYMFVRGKIIGGTTVSPISLMTEVNNNEWNNYRVYLMNGNNAFRGDVYIGASGTGSKGNMFLYLGYGSILGTDSMLGHPDNTVILRNQRPNLCVSRCDSEGLKRRILGTGNVRGLRVDTAWPTLTNPDALVLGDGSSLEPSVEFSNPIGKITVIGSALTTHANSQIRINVTPTEHDTVEFRGTSASPIRARC